MQMSGTRAINFMDGIRACPVCFKMLILFGTKNIFLILLYYKNTYALDLQIFVSFK